MTHEFDKAYWEEHWRPGSDAGSGDDLEGLSPNPYLLREVGDLTPGTALDAGCGEGAEAIWLASRGWQVTGADLSSEALARAAEREVASDTAGRVHWVEADLSVWEPTTPYDLVTTHYAHPAIPQLDFYRRIAGWVALGGTLLIVGHRDRHSQDSRSHDGHSHDGHSHDSEGPPAEATVTLEAVTAGLDPRDWEVVTAEEHVRTVARPGGRTVELLDVVVRATRKA